MTKKRNKHTRDFRRWTSAEVILLSMLVKEGATDDEISMILSRKKRSIQVKKNEIFK